MINAVIYLDQNFNAELLAKLLLENKLAASVSIDINNNQYILENDQIVKKTHNVLSIQTKSLLFSKITEFVEATIGPEIPIYSVPLTQTNLHFDQFIRKNTKTI